MTITQLKYVLAVAQYQNFTRAADKVFVTQPTLSMQIQKLEDELDVQIFDRSKKPIELTETGKKIVTQARNIVNESDRIQDIVDQEKGFIGGEFRLGIIPTIMPTLLPMFMNNFIKKYSKVKLRIEELTTENILERLNDGSLDAAIAATPLEDGLVKKKVLYYEPFVVYDPASKKAVSEKMDVEEIDPDKLLLLEDGHCFKDSVLNLCRSSRDTQEERFSLMSGSFETLIKLADEGLGMTLLPFLNTEELHDRKKANLRYFKEPNPAREVSLIYHKSELKMQIIDALHQVIAGVVKGAIAFHNVNIISPVSQK